jgi:hypothetical protein
MMQGWTLTGTNVLAVLCLLSFPFALWWVYRKDDE